jgi:hypothetical protein
MAQKKLKSKTRPDELPIWADLAELMSFLIARRHGLLTVKQIAETQDEIGAEDPLTEVVIQVKVPNPKAADGTRFFPIDHYLEFFESWTTQKAFIVWLGRALAEMTPKTGVNAKYRKRFERLGVGHPSKLPPRFYLRRRKTQLLAELRVIRALFQNRHNELVTDLGQQRLLNELPTLDPVWLRLLKSGELEPAGIMMGNSNGVVNYLLSLEHGTSEEAIRSKLLRDD